MSLDYERCTGGCKKSYSIWDLQERGHEWLCPDCCKKHDEKLPKIVAEVEGLPFPKEKQLEILFRLIEDILMERQELTGAWYNPDGSINIVSRAKEKV